MIRLQNQDLIKEYYESVKEEYPDLTFDELKEIVSTPFNMVKETMEKGELCTIRLKYFGTFLVFTRRAKGLLKTLTQRFKEHSVPKEQYFETKKIIEDYLKKHGLEDDPEEIN